MSVGSEVTEAYAEVFDAKREIFLDGVHGLEIIRNQTSIGYTVVKVIDEGWFGERVTDHALGAEFFEFRIAETDEDLSSLFREPISHLKVGEHAYKIAGGQVPNISSFHIWLVRCSPTGERVTGTYALATRSGSRLVTLDDEVLRVHA